MITSYYCVSYFKSDDNCAKSAQKERENMDMIVWHFCILYKPYFVINRISPGEIS